MKYQIADLVNGPFGEVFETLEAAEKALEEVIREGQAINDQVAEDVGCEAANAADFFEIVEVQDNDE